VSSHELLSSKNERVQRLNRNRLVLQYCLQMKKVAGGEDDIRLSELVRDLT